MDRNYNVQINGQIVLVVPYVGTWIEILHGQMIRCPWKSRSLRGNVDRNPCQDLSKAGKQKVVPYVGTWIEIVFPPSAPPSEQGRSLRGNVDRNDTITHCPRIHRVVPYVGTWIEMR